MAATAPEGAETLRWYTSALRIPRLIGKLTSGERIWGGPYTVTQACVGVVLLVVGIKSMSWWGQLHLAGEGLVGFLGNWALLAGGTFAAVKLAGRLPAARVNTHLAVTGGARQLKAGAAGTWRGRAPVTGRRTHKKGRIVLTELTPHARPVELVTPQPITPTVPAPAASPAAEQPTRPAQSVRLSAGADAGAAPAPSTPAVVDKLAALVGH